ncbi:MAG TPA: hypothetical protein VFP89_07585 [Propionibacteriaceae bacterium]|nr:hypothetical protein [Propionibacteriaceae bacterium]
MTRRDVVVIGGLASSTVLTLLSVRVLCTLVERRGASRRRTPLLEHWAVGALGG